MIKSPITGKDMILSEEPNFEVTYKKETFIITRRYWLCQDSGEEFIDEKIEDEFMEEIERLYLEKMGGIGDLKLKGEG